MPDWNDEDQAYALRPEVTNTDVGVWEHIEGGNYSASQLDKFKNHTPATSRDLHADTESDFLWTAYHMWKRLEGIKPNSIWADKVVVSKEFFITTYQTIQFDDSGAASGPTETDVNQDHAYGWGLCDWYASEGASEPDGGAAALAAINQLVQSYNDWFSAGGQFPVAPGDTIFDRAPGMRRWARQLRFAVRAAEVSPTAFNIAWRDRVIDIVLQGPDFDPDAEAYVYADGAPRIYDGFSYANGDRLANAFHSGILGDALYHAWRVLNAEGDPRALTIGDRLVKQGTFWRDNGEDSVGEVQLLTGVNINSGVSLHNLGSSSQGIYTISPVATLVYAYKLTGDSSYLDKAWAYWMKFQTNHGLQFVGGFTEGDLSHYTDSQLASGDNFRNLAHNKGQLQYIYPLFENGGDPVVTGEFALKPSWFTAEADNTWFTAPNPNTDPATNWIDAVAASNNGFDITSNKTSKMPHYVTGAWSTAVARQDFLSFVGNGGHAASGDNASYSFGPFTSESPKWHRDSDPSQPDTVPTTGGFVHPDGRSASAHNYSHQCYIPELGTTPELGRRCFMPGRASLGHNGTGGIAGPAATFFFDSETNSGGDWDLVGSGTEPPDFNVLASRDHGGCCWVSDHQLVFFAGAGSSENRQLRTYDPVTRTVNIVGGDVIARLQQCAYDPVRKIIVGVDNLTPGIVVIDLADFPNSTSSTIFAMSYPPSQYMSDGGPTKGGLEYEPVSGKYVLFVGAEMHELVIPADYRTGDGSPSNPINGSATYSFQQITPATAVRPSDPGLVGNDRIHTIFGMFRYIPSIHAFVAYMQSAAGHNYPVWVYKIPEGGL